MVLTKTSRAAKEEMMPMPIFQSKPRGLITGSMSAAHASRKTVTQLLALFLTIHGLDRIPLRMQCSERIRGLEL